jgi:hypothetical protein
MLSRLARLLLTASAIAPVSFTYAWVAYMQSQLTVAIWAAAVGLIALNACVILLGFAQRNIESFDFAPQTIEAADTESLGFMLLYLFPLFTDQISNLHWELWAPIIAIFSVIIATGHSYHFNPLLGLAQWVARPARRLRAGMRHCVCRRSASFYFLVKRQRRRLAIPLIPAQAGIQSGCPLSRGRAATGRCCNKTRARKNRAARAIDLILRCEAR